MNDPATPKVPAQLRFRSHAEYTAHRASRGLKGMGPFVPLVPTAFSADGATGAVYLDVTAVVKIQDQAMQQFGSADYHTCMVVVKGSSYDLEVMGTALDIANIIRDHSAAFARGEC
jgi:hypothetical protein